jgi:SPP1 gp7 family putative phage head morphogenesis protein
LIQGTRYNKDLFTNNAIPDIIVSLPKVPKEKLLTLKRNWNRSYKGKPHQIGFVNWAIDKFYKLAGTNRDLEWLDGQKWYFKIVFGVFGVSPTEAGFFENSNKSNDDGQERVTVRNALKPFLHLLEKVHTIRTITEILQKEDHGLKFKFFPKDHTAEKIEFDQDMKELEIGAQTINEYRKKKGKDKVDWGDEPLRRPFNPAEGFANFAGEPGNPCPKKPEDNPDNPCPKDDDKKKDKFLKDLEIDAGEDVIEEAEDYSDFLLKTFDNFEKKVLAAADKITVNKSMAKNFGEFLATMFNAVNTKAFAGQVKRYLKADLISGMLSAEAETGVDIGFTQAYQDKLNQLQGQQVDGYTINGKKWPGIKGVTKELQAKIIQTVQSGINENKSVKEIKESIKKDFDGFSEWRTNMIARTETNRMINEGKLIGYKETKIKGKKFWSTAIDNRTSDICRRLNGQSQELDSPFLDEKTMKAFATPPAHPHCRSVIYFKPD